MPIAAAFIPIPMVQTTKLATPSSTDDGRVMAISQILYGQYHIWDIYILYVLGLKTKLFCWNNNQIHFPMDRGLTVQK